MMCLMIQESENSEPFVSSEIDILLLVRKFNGNLMRKYRAFVTQHRMNDKESKIITFVSTAHTDEHI